ncbi:bifunctional diaminohydroxyphosphoribosylaminopyrimidine deaminase/5-amino-6-(5-phosphoribosylamino)uracil reductase RibD [Altererythrobacter aurantiacus]|uniref:Riboflavin biosynthesis protein RibD n=1 Tax=Parapontixanthobacter aurantiacus TaxID=1463599 RepID=A0A844ZC30_9SPHN|nr:bifunctional diaminohydroxyphosphoribosylaminopyrimidine deaminase/5-amino-6-(5-phosphoribosylamino)uracil reductase RibD [Parapontixanthobacter aurantiacus]
MSAAARLAARSRPLSAPNPGVGAVVVRFGAIVGRGWTSAGGRPHAEANALKEAGNLAKGASVYVTLEPCAHASPRGPSCADLLVETGVSEVFIGCRDPDSRTDGAGIKRLEAAGIRVRLVKNEACYQSLAGYLMQRRSGRPHVTLKLAMSLDGKIALADGSSRWITGEVSRNHVHARRAQSDAILVGGGTWRSDAPRLDVRLPGVENRSPRRILLSRGPAPEGVDTLADPLEIATLDGILYLYVEGGAETAAAFLSHDLVDRLEIYRAPIVIGEGLSAIGDIGLSDLSGAHGRWRLVDTRPLGSDLFTAYERTR